MKIVLFMLFLTVNIRNPIFEKQGRIKAPGRLYPDISAGAFIWAAPLCEIIGYVCVCVFVCAHV